MPLLLQITVVIAAEQLTTAYKKRPEIRRSAQRSAFLGAALYVRLGHLRRHLGRGVAVLVRAGQLPRPGLSGLAFLGMTATEFIARSAHRPAYLVHTVFALGPLVALLLLAGRALCRHDRGAGGAVSPRC